MIVQEMAPFPIRWPTSVCRQGKCLQGGLVNGGMVLPRESADRHRRDAYRSAIMIDELNFEDRKLVEVAGGTPASNLIADETTTLSSRGAISSFLCRRFSEQGSGIIFISHDLDEILKSHGFDGLRDGC